MSNKKAKKALIESLRSIGTFAEINEDIITRFEKMAEDGMLMTNDGKKVEKNEISYNDLDSILIRADAKDDPYTITKSENGYSVSEKPMTAAEFAIKAHGTPPAKPGRIRNWIDTIKKKVFRMKDGDAKCRKYEKDKADYDKKAYYTLKSAGYEVEKPLNVAKEEREYAVRGYVLASNALEQKNIDGDYRIENDPMYQTLMNDPKIDDFVNSPKVQGFIKMVKDAGFKTPEALANDSGLMMFTHFASDPERTGWQPSAIDGLISEDTLFAMNAAKNTANAAKEARENVNKRYADAVMRDVRKKIDEPDDQRFLKELDTIVHKNFDEAKKVLYAVNEMSKKELSVLSDEYEMNIGNTDYSLEKKLNGIANKDEKTMAEFNSQLDNQNIDKLNDGMIQYHK